MPHAPPDVAGSLVSGAFTASGGSLVRGVASASGGSLVRGMASASGGSLVSGPTRDAGTGSGPAGRGGGIRHLSGEGGEQKLCGGGHGGLLAVG